MKIKSSWIFLCNWSGYTREICQTCWHQHYNIDINSCSKAGLNILKKCLPRHSVYLYIYMLALHKLGILTTITSSYFEHPKLFSTLQLQNYYRFGIFFSNQAKFNLQVLIFDVVNQTPKKKKGDLKMDSKYIAGCRSYVNS